MSEEEIRRVIERLRDFARDLAERQAARLGERDDAADGAYIALEGLLVALWG